MLRSSPLEQQTRWTGTFIRASMIEAEAWRITRVTALVGQLHPVREFIATAVGVVAPFDHVASVNKAPAFRTMHFHQRPLVPNPTELRSGRLFRGAR
jgi:hypothetical protein